MERVLLHEYPDRVGETAVLTRRTVIIGLGLGLRPGLGNAGRRSNTTNIAVLTLHGDSRICGIYEAARPGVDDVQAGVEQWVSDFNAPGVADNDFNFFSLPVGFTSAMPLQGAARTFAADVLSPFQYAAQRLIDDGIDKVVLLGSGWGSNHLLGVPPNGGGKGSSHGTYTFKKMEAGLAAVIAANPGAAVHPIICIEHGVNDMVSAAEPADLKGAADALIPWLRTARGWGRAPALWVSITPEERSILGVSALGDTATRISMLTQTDCYWTQYPTGIGQLHEGDSYTGAPRVRTAGYDHIGRSLGVILGLVTPAAPVVTIEDGAGVEEGSGHVVNLPANKKLYYTVSAGKSDVELSGDLENDFQVLRSAAVGNIWRAYTGTSADDIAYRLSWRDADGVIGSTSGLNVTVKKAVAATYLAYDNFNRADTKPSETGLGTTSGDGSTGGGLTWVVKTGCAAGISGNKAVLPWDGAAGTYVVAGVNVRTRRQIVKCRMAVASGFAAHLIAGGNDPTVVNPGYGVYFSSAGSLYWAGPLGARSFGTFKALSPGTYDVEIRLDAANDQAGLWINGAKTIPMTKTAFADDLSGVGTFAGIAMEYIGSTHTWDDFCVEALA